MITDNMRLTSRRDADLWASELTEGIDDGINPERVSDWIWVNKTGINCTYEEFRAVHEDFLCQPEFFEIIGAYNETEGC